MYGVRGGLIPLIALVVLLLPSFFHAWQRNAWSLSYLQYSTGVTSSLPVPGPSTHPRAPIWLAQDALRKGELERALQLAQPLTETDSPYARRVVASIQFANNQLEAAFQNWAAIGDVESLWHAGQVLMENGQVREAELAYRAAWQVDPVAGLLPLANFLHEEKKDTPAAITLLRDTISSQPHARLRRSWLHRLGALLRAQSQWDEAASVYQQAITDNPQDSRAYIELGWVYYERGDGVEAALAEFHKTIEATPSYAKGYHSIGVLLIREKRYEEADGWLRDAIARAPNNLQWYVTRAKAAQVGGNLPLTLSVYAEAAARFPESVVI
nr:tetratricopeptide repeat protein [Ardenticatenales bacterium]